jgi:DNA-binding NarL/FixJ family response regulator
VTQTLRVVLVDDHTIVREGLRVLVLSMHDGEDFVRPAIRAGASGYVDVSSRAGQL